MSRSCNFTAGSSAGCGMTMRDATHRANHKGPVVQANGPASRIRNFRRTCSCPRSSRICGAMRAARHSSDPTASTQVTRAWFRPSGRTMVARAFRPWTDLPLFSPPVRADDGMPESRRSSSGRGTTVNRLSDAEASGNHRAPCRATSQRDLCKYAYIVISSRSNLPQSDCSHNRHIHDSIACAIGSFSLDCLRNRRYGLLDA